MGIFRYIIILVADYGLASPVAAQTSKLQQGRDHFMDGSYTESP